MSAALGPRALLRAATRHRAVLSAGLAAASVAAGLQAVTPSREPTVPVVLASRDLPAGALLGAADLRSARWPRSAAPSRVLGSSDAASGRLLAGPVRSGEVLTDVRLVGAGLLAGLRSDGLVGTPVRLADPQVATFLRPGDVVDVLEAATGPGAAGPAQVAAAGVRVLAVPALADDNGEGALVLLATRRADAARLAAAAVQGRLSVVVLPH